MISAAGQLDLYCVTEHRLILLAFLRILSTIYDPYQSDQKKTCFTDVVRACACVYCEMVLFTLQRFYVVVRVEFGNVIFQTGQNGQVTAHQRWSVCIVPDRRFLP